MRDATGTGIARLTAASEPEDPLALEVFAHLRSVGREPRPMHRALAMSPAVLDANYRLAMALRHHTGVKRAYAELAILRTAQLEGGDYVYAAHREADLASLTQTQIDAIVEWRTNALFDHGERAVLAFVEALAARREVPQEIYDGLAAVLTSAEIVELTATVGFYVAAARMACAFALKA